MLHDVAWLLLLLLLLLQGSKYHTSDRTCLVRSSSVIATPAAFTSAM